MVASLFVFFARSLVVFFSVSVVVVVCLRLLFLLFLLLLHLESVAFVLDDVLVVVVVKKIKKTRGPEDSGPSLNKGVLHQIRAAQTDPSNCHLIIWNCETSRSAC